MTQELRRTLLDLPGIARVYEGKTREVNQDENDQRWVPGVYDRTENVFVGRYDPRAL